MDEKQTKQNGPGGIRRNLPAAAVFFLLLLMAAFLIAGISGAFGQKSEVSSSSASSGTGTSGGTGASGGTAASSPAAGGASASSDGYVLPSSSGASVSTSGSQAPAKQQAPDSASSSPDSGPQSTASDSGTTLKDKFGLLSDGMTYAQAQAVCGSGALVTEVGGTQVYEWRDPDSDGSFIRVTFKDGKLVRKYRFGL